MDINIVYLNGEFLPLDQAQISVLDRGFLFADGVYEVIPVYKGRIFRCEQHLERLQASLQAIQLNISVSIQHFKTILQELLAYNGNANSDYSLYLQVTRGVYPTRAHVFQDNIKPTIFAQCSPMTVYSMEQLQQGATAITLPDTRWQNCYIKSIALLPNVLLAQQAKAAGAQEAILIRDGYALEGASSNLFIVKNNVIKTPPRSPHILGGITRTVVLELLAQHHFDYLETSIKEKELQDADEIWITSSTREIMPVVRLNNQMVGHGKAGALWEQAIKFFREFKNNF